MTRTQALRLAGTDLARRVSPCALRELLQRAAAAELPIMVFVGNPGITQIRSGTVRRVSDTPPWYNVLDPGFDLHVREPGIAQAWVVRKPTRNGIITALELYDPDGAQIALIVSKRMSGNEECGAWRGILASLSPGPALPVDACIPDSGLVQQPDVGNIQRLEHFHLRERSDRRRVLWPWA